MSITPKDPLLTAARFLLGAAMALSAFVGAIVIAVIPFLLFNQPRVLAELSTQGAPPEVMGAILILFALVIACAALGFFFFRHLYRMVATVATDPFVPANADRLRAMGWIVVAFHILTIPLAAMAEYIDSVTDKVHTNADISIGGILLALILFILARVFRKGAEMRADLEGTV